MYLTFTSSLHTQMEMDISKQQTEDKCKIRLIHNTLVLSTWANINEKKQGR